MRADDLREIRQEFRAEAKSLLSSLELGSDERHELSRLRTENRDLLARIASDEHKGSLQRVSEIQADREKLNQERRQFETDKKLEYDKGYADAYTAVTNKMK